MRIRKRIELENIKVFRSETATENPDGSGGNGNNTQSVPDCGIKFRLRGETLDGFGPRQPAEITDENGEKHPLMGGWNETEIAFNVSDSDIPRVLAWFDDNYHGVTEPESALLRKNRSTAVHEALKRYRKASDSSNLFTSPFRIAWRYRYSDNTCSGFHDCGVLSCFRTAPLLPVMSHQLSGKYLHTRVQVRNVSARLMYRLDATPSFTALRNRITAIDIYATKQVGMYPEDGEVAGIRSVTVDGTPRRCWYYDRYTEEDVNAQVMSDTDFRLIGSVPADEITGSDDYMTLQMSAGILADFSSLPKPEDNRPSPAGKTIHLRTEPLHLDYPEDEKSVRNLTLRGIFRRDKVKMRLYASQHRETRHLIASATGPYIRGLFGARWRWFEVEIECPMREGDFFDAITFEFANPKH